MADIKKMKERYIRLYGDEGISDMELCVLESKLGVSLPVDFKEISDFFSGGSLGSVSNHAFDEESTPTNIIAETIRLRTSINLLPTFMVLAEPAESLIVLDTINSKVLWCDANDTMGLSGNDFVRAPEVWSSYSDFFEFMLSEAEQEQIG